MKKKKAKNQITKYHYT